jgi:hypothetical protein
MAKFALVAPFTSKHVADAFVNEWIDAARENRDVNGDNIAAVIKPMLNDDNGKRRVKIIVDSKPSSTGDRTLLLVSPLAENAVGQSVEDWVNGKWADAAALQSFGDAILAGCGK